MALEYPTQEELKIMFDYTAAGALIWKINNKRARAGAVAGASSKTTIVITINYKVFNAHRLVFLWHHGYMPKYIDHINGNPFDNRIENLRPCTPGENTRNSKSRLFKNGVACSSKFKGVHKCKQTGKWRAVLNMEGRTLHLGRYENEEDAAKAYDREAVVRFAEFARLNFPERPA